MNCHRINCAKNRAGLDNRGKILSKTLSKILSLAELRSSDWMVFCCVNLSSQSETGNEFKDFNLKFCTCTLLCTGLKCIEIFHKDWDFVHKIWDSAFKHRIHGSTESPVRRGFAAWEA